MIAADSSGRLHVVWQDETAGNEEIYYKRSTDGGATWATSQRFTWNGADSLHPVIAVGLASDIHLAFWDGASGGYEIYHKKSTDGGATWTASQRLTWSSGGPESPSLVVDSTGGLHVAWHDPVSGNYEVYYKKSTDGGATWTASQRLTWTSGTSQFPVLACHSPGLLHLVWQDSTPGNNEIYHKLSTNAGGSWEAADRLTWSSGDSVEPAIESSGSAYLHVVFADGTPINHEIYYKSGAWKLAVGTGVRE
jgi:hypothetical protein